MKAIFESFAAAAAALIYSAVLLGMAALMVVGTEAGAPPVPGPADDQRVRASAPPLRVLPVRVIGI
jgi:hypothetical protein